MRAVSKNSGFSLLETVVYTAILAVLTVFVANTMLLSFTSLRGARINRRIIVSADTALERMIRESRIASSVDDAQSTLGTSPSVLVLNTVVSATDDASIVKKFFVSGGRLALQEGAGAVKFLTAPDTSISSFIVSKTSSVHSQAVKVDLVIESSGGKFQTSRNFYISAVLRGGY